MKNKNYSTQKIKFGLGLLCCKNKDVVTVKLCPEYPNPDKNMNVINRTLDIQSRYPYLTGRAKCHPNDEFDFRKGVGLATLRLLEQYYKKEEHRITRMKNAIGYELKNRLDKIGRPE